MKHDTSPLSQPGRLFAQFGLAVIIGLVSLPVIILTVLFPPWLEIHCQRRQILYWSERVKIHEKSYAGFDYFSSREKWATTKTPPNPSSDTLFESTEFDVCWPLLACEWVAVVAVAGAFYITLSRRFFSNAGEHEPDPGRTIACTGAGGRAGFKWKVVTAGPVMRGVGRSQWSMIAVPSRGERVGSADRTLHSSRGQPRVRFDSASVTSARSVSHSSCVSAVGGRFFDCKSLAVRDNARVLVRCTRIDLPTTPCTRPATRGGKTMDRRSSPACDGERWRAQSSVPAAPLSVPSQFGPRTVRLLVEAGGVTVFGRGATAELSPVFQRVSNC